MPAAWLGKTYSHRTRSASKFDSNLRRNPLLGIKTGVRRRVWFPLPYSVAASTFAIALADSAGYVLPSSGTVSTTQFYIGPELSNGTACGVSALPNSRSASGKQGGSPGHLYKDDEQAAINHFAFGTNPSVFSSGGAGGTCGVSYQLTPVPSSGSALSSQAMAFMTGDEWPAAVSPSGRQHCKHGGMERFASS
ncbi:hypothetical protein K432DRAFT_426233 [Lepidopterella palustris CBS 459.81]|uniref:Uncharacterized protein n=1 Tax=Lepidopterella palustris CBS 459.81 TaxID=1314670 RepID=A0A8E2E9Q1_9PEZI|nr:hypothetical protein K432DRAFT_426233 [Lepidopterella palustris CBS 459.81]